MGKWFGFLRGRFTNEETFSSESVAHKIKRFLFNKKTYCIYKKEITSFPTEDTEKSWQPITIRSLWENSSLTKGNIGARINSLYRGNTGYYQMEDNRLKQSFWADYKLISVKGTKIEEQLPKRSA